MVHIIALQSTATVSYPIRQAAEEAIKILFDENEKRPSIVVCESELIVRKSTRKVQKG